MTGIARTPLPLRLPFQNGFELDTEILGRRLALVWLAAGLQSTMR